MKQFTLLFLLLLSSFMISAQDCANGWSFYRTITVDNSGGDNLTDYQVSFTLNTADLVANGK